MRGYALRVLVFLAALSAGILLVSFFAFVDSGIDNKYPIPDSLSAPTQPETYLEPPTLDYWPLSMPRLGGARLAIHGRAWNEEQVTSRYEKWLGLYITATGYEVRESQVRIKGHQVNDQEHGQIWDIRDVVIDGRAKPLIAFKGIGNIRKGSAKTVFVNHRPNGSFDYEGTWDCSGAHLSLGGIVYRVYSEEIQEYEGKCSGSGRVTISDESSKQILHDPESRAMGYVDYTDSRLVWAGDLDGDRKLDVLLSLGLSGCSTYYTSHVLYLSSYAEPGELVAPVAEYENFDQDW